MLANVSVPIFRGRIFFDIDFSFLDASPIPLLGESLLGLLFFMVCTFAFRTRTCHYGILYPIPNSITASALGFIFLVPFLVLLCTPC